ncbi:hypothetical protein Tco_0652868 [Tanacetum coccineum]|uniref:Transposase n=1 Tax=Tanacetum coccineum TaxID=301880 RepID=A0ABQ4WYV0_9ASTR
MSKAFRAKAKGEREIRGDHVLQYSMVRDYVIELQSTTPNTTVKIVVERNTDPSLPTRVFKRIYICLEALKLGFRACRRNLLGLDAESKSSWCWFLQYLSDDIDLHHNSNFTFISDRQNGWCGQAYKDLLRRTASATNVRDFEKCMLELKMMNPKVFNGKIVEGRDKPVITLLEYIREYCMKRIMNVQGVIDKCTGPLTLTATRIMESIKKEAHLMKELTGIPCKHVVAACWNMALNDWAAPPPETWVNPCYWLSTWKEIYSHKIQPICMTKYWEKSTCPTTLLPPKHHVQVGRSRKKRKRSKHEDEPFVKDGKLSKKGRTITFQSCGNIGHNKATCKGQGDNNAEASGAGAVIGLSVAAGEGSAGGPGGAGVANQVPVSETRNADGREMGAGVLKQSSAAGGASEWSFL